MKRLKGELIASRDRWQIRLADDKLYYVSFAIGKAGIKAEDLAQLAGMFQEAYESSQKKKRGYK